MLEIWWYILSRLRSFAPTQQVRFKIWAQHTDAWGLWAQSPVKFAKETISKITVQKSDKKRCSNDYSVTLNVTCKMMIRGKIVHASIHTSELYKVFPVGFFPQAFFLGIRKWNRCWHSSEHHPPVAPGWAPHIIWVLHNTICYLTSLYFQQR